MIDITVEENHRIKNLFGSENAWTDHYCKCIKRNIPTSLTLHKCPWHEPRPKGGDIWVCGCRFKPTDHRDPMMGCAGHVELRSHGQDPGSKSV